MTRVLSGAALAAFAIAIVWFAPAWLFFAVGFVLAVLAVNEVVTLAQTSGLAVSKSTAGFAAALVVGSSGVPEMFQIVLMTAMVAVAASSLGAWRGGPGALASVAATLLPALYVGLPVSALLGIRTLSGPRGLFLLMLTVMVSDTSQYYTGRAFGRRPLAPMVSPKKTVEGAIGGAVIASAVFAVVGIWWLPQLAAPFRAILGLTIVVLGIVGDLFESMLKRSAGVKDSSALIPGHGGVLDRIDALLFAAPVYYIVLRYV
jgi:phosphatidate cytidylyltransferase